MKAGNSSQRGRLAMVQLRTKTGVHWPLLFLLLALGAASGASLAQRPAATAPPTVQRPAKANPAKPKPPPALTEAEINEARQRLLELGYWVLAAAPAEDAQAAQAAEAALRHAVIAFQKLAQRPRTGKLTIEELQALRAAQRPLALEPQATPNALHVEIDLAKQVLWLVNPQGVVDHILPISSGSGAWFTEGGRTRRAVTPVGRFQITRKITGWRKSPLGLLYFPNYFHNGVAIHGNPAVPATPASHGCVRIPMFAAPEFSASTPIGTVVLVYGATTETMPIQPCKQ